MNRIYAVGQVNAYIKAMFDQDFVLNRISVKGEVSNCKYHTSGHIYFSLKDDTGAIACIMFASARRGLAFRLENGQQIVVEGSVSVYERDGRYQLYANRITLQGAGLLYERFEALKAELSEMGMFAPEYKQPIPPYIFRLGIVTAPTGAAVRDIITVSKRRNPYIQLILYPALVQGEGAADSIVRGIQMMEQADVDACIVGRGGGSIEDLWAFNEEKVARAAFACRVPLISAVGHETDTTILDFVADLRAPTPSAAAELAVADISAVFRRMEQAKGEMDRQMADILQLARVKTEYYRRRLEQGSPQYRLREQRQRLIEKEEKLNLLMESVLREKRGRLQVYIEKLKGMSPLEKLNQGYFAVMDEEGRRISRAGDTAPGRLLTLYASDGRIEARTEKVYGREDS